jgi:hypothetical protein
MTRRGGRRLVGARAREGAVVGLDVEGLLWTDAPHRCVLTRRRRSIGSSRRAGRRPQVARVEVVQWRDLASIAYYAGFGAFLLNMVEFLTNVWHFSAIDAGLAIAPGPLMVLPFARSWHLG